MATTASTIESTAGAAGSPFDQEQLLAGPLSQPVLAASDPLTLPDPSQQSLTISEEQASASGLGWDALDAAVASLGAEPAPVSEPSPAHLDVEPASTLVDLDQLTGLLAATDPNVLPASLVEGNLPPLLGEAFSTDQLLAQPDAAAIDLLAAVDAIRLGEGAEAILLPASAADPALEPAPLERRFTLEEDQLFSLALADLFPLDGDLVTLTIQPLTAEAGDWLSLEQRRPDPSLIERVLVETLLRDAEGHLLSAEEIAALAPGSRLQADLVVTDTRFDGLGLIGLDLDLQWNPAALTLQQVDLDAALPLFRDSGSLDALGGRLTGLAGAALPSAGSGAVLGDGLRDRFASLSFELGHGVADGLGLQLTPTKLPTRHAQALDPAQVLALGSDPALLPVLRGWVTQAQVGEQRFLLDGLMADGRRRQQQVVLDIRNINDAPEALALPALSALEDQPLQIDLHSWFSDDDLTVGDQLSFHLVGVQPAWLQLDGERGRLTGQPDQPQVGVWQLEVEARDRSGATARQSVALTIEGVDDAPQWSGEELPLILLRQERAFTIALPSDLFSDQDPGDTLTYSLDLQGQSELASWLELDALTGGLSGIAPLTISDPFSIGLIATDSTGLTSSVALQLQVVDHTFNRAPYTVGAAVEERTIQEGESIRFDLPALFRDDDAPIGDQLRFEVEAPAWLQFDPASGVVSGLADNGAVGTHTISFRAEDLDGATAVSTFVLTVQNVNQAPERLAPAQEGRLLQTGSSLQLDLDTLFTDSDRIHGDWLNYTLRARSTSSLGSPDWLSWNSATGELALNPGADDRGLLSLQFTANDRSGASSTYQLDLGIVSADGLVEVNQALEPLRIRPDELTAVDLADAFRQLRGGDQLDYTFELLRRGADGRLTTLTAEQADWLTLVDRQAEPVQRQDRLTIEPVLRLRDSGERVTVAELSDLAAGTALELTLTVDDLRQASRLPGVIGVDLALDWSGLSLSDDNPADLREAISAALPLFRNVDTSALAEGQLRFSAAGLPALGIGEALGDQPSERLFSLNLRLDDPAQPVRLDLSLMDEERGGLGLGLADGSDGDDWLNLLDLSSTPQFDLRLAPTAEDLGQYALRLWATAPDGDAVSQIVSLQVGSGFNAAPERITAPQAFNVADNVRQRLGLERLFRDSDGDQLTYNLQIRAADPAEEALLRDAIRLVQTASGTSLDFSIPGLLQPVRGVLVLAASDGALQTSQTIQLMLNPRSQLVPLYANPHHPAVRGGQAVGLSDLFAAPALRFADRADQTQLAVRSDEPLNLRLSADYRRLSGLTAQQAEAIEASWRHADDPLQQTIAVSALAQALPTAASRFELNWLEVVAPAQPASAVAIELASRSSVASDPDGSRYGLSESDWKRAVLVTSPAAAAPAVTPASERYLANLLSSRGLSLGTVLEEVAQPLQTSTALLAWRSQADFAAAVAGTLQDVRPVVALRVSGVSDAAGEPLPALAETLYQVQDLTVLGRNDARFAGFDVSGAVPDDLRIAAAWDPLSFTIVKAADAEALADADPLRAGTQVVLELDVSGADLSADYFNAYSKFVAPETLAAAQQQGLVLRDLDQRPITSAGWHDFTQRLDASGHPVGDGARFVVETVNGRSRLSKILITFTDNAFGDNNLSLGVIDDPGMPMRLAAAPQPVRPGNQLQRAVLPMPVGLNPQGNAPVAAAGLPADGLSPATAGDASAVAAPPTGLPGPDPLEAASGAGGPVREDPMEPAAGRGVSLSASRGRTAARPAPGSAPTSDGSEAAAFLQSGSAVVAGAEIRPSSAMAAASSDAAAGDGQPSPDLQLSDARPASLELGRSRRAAADSAAEAKAMIEAGLPRWSIATDQPHPLQTLVHQLVDLVGDESTLVGLMMGMLVIPGGVERSLRSLLESGLGRTIQLQRRNPDLEAQWSLQLRDPSGQTLGLQVRLQQGRLLLTPQPSSSADAVLLTGERGGTLWQLLGSLSHPGDLIEQLDRRLDQLLRAPLEEQDLAWTGWLDQLSRQRQPARTDGDAAVWTRLEELRQSVASAAQVDPGLADALMLMELLDCHVRLGGQLPWLSSSSAIEPV